MRYIELACVTYPALDHSHVNCLTFPDLKFIKILGQVISFSFHFLLVIQEKYKREIRNEQRWRSVGGVNEGQCRKQQLEKYSPFVYLLHAIVQIKVVRYFCYTIGEILML